MKGKPINRNILIRLPEWHKKKERKAGRIIIPYLIGNLQHNCSHGTVVSVADDCEFVKVGDEVFFTINTVNEGLRNIGRDESVDEAWKRTGSSSPVHYIQESDNDYLIMPEQRIYTEIEDTNGVVWENPSHAGVICLKRGEETIALNGYHLMTKGYYDGELVSLGNGFGSAMVKKGSGLILGVEKITSEKSKRYEVLFAPVDSEIKRGDVIYTMPHTDLPLEGEFNNPVFPKDTYYCEVQNINAVMKTTSAAA